ncbi:MAG: riboflavin kinase / adenylyltransferase [Gaiellaceae bacterium]|jgi:riboflavin kinase/FMN adenylyltransferase|nr:riboflavin kinase / adenylyltransferase [Gaiellaceae bacterium]
MNVVRLVDNLEEARRGVAVGTFDGVHLGHRRVIEAARAAGLRTAVVTFDPHPRAVLGREVELLTTLERRLELLAEAGVDDVVVLAFDETLANLEPTEFAELILRGMGAELVAAGETFRFGRDRQGDLTMLETLGFDIRRVPVFGDVSSSRIREYLHAGEPERAARLLGRPAEVEGIVVHGNHRGRELGFPTANLDVPPGLLVPPDGVYAGWTRDRLAAISIGTNPQFGGVERSVEAHLLDFDDDLYDQRLVVEIWSWLRGQMRFESVEALVEQIGADVAQAREATRPS